MQETIEEKQNLINDIFKKSIFQCNCDIIGSILMRSKDTSRRQLSLEVLKTNNVSFLEDLMILALNCGDKQLIASLSKNQIIKNMNSNTLIELGKHQLIPFFVLIGQTHCINNLLGHYLSDKCRYNEENQVKVMTECLNTYRINNGGKEHMFPDTLVIDKRTFDTNDITLTLIESRHIQLFKIVCDHTVQFSDFCDIIADIINLITEDKLQDQFFDILMTNKSKFVQPSIDDYRKLMNYIDISPHVKLTLEQLIQENKKTNDVAKNKTHIEETSISPWLSSLISKIESGNITSSDLILLEQHSKGREILVEFGLLDDC